MSTLFVPVCESICKSLWCAILHVHMGERILGAFVSWRCAISFVMLNGMLLYIEELNIEYVVP